MFKPKISRSSITTPSRSDTGPFFQGRCAGVFRSPDASSKEPAAVAQEESCAGWESDPQSFCIRVARFYLETEYKITASAKTVNTEDDGSCKVIFDDGTEVIVLRDDAPKQGVLVILWHPKKGMEPKNCRYTYQCPASGTLELTRVDCGGSR